MAMASWARRPNPSSSSSSSASSSASSLCMPDSSVLDLADDLWFYRSVIPFPHIELPCFPPVLIPAAFSSPPAPDTSTLLAECMRDRGPLSSSSPPAPPSPPPSSADLDRTDCQFCFLPPPAEATDCKNGGGGGSDDDDDNDIAFTYGNLLRSKDGRDVAFAYGDSSRSESGGEEDDDDNNDNDWFCSRLASGEDEDAFHYYSATSDWDDEDVHNCYPDEPSLQSIKEHHVSTYPREQRSYYETRDALSGIYDVASLLKRQHYQEVEANGERRIAVPSSRPQLEAVKQLPAIAQIQVLSRTDQADMKESLKIWAHAVALTLPWKAAANARPFL